MTLPPADIPPVAVEVFQELTEDQKVAFVGEYGVRKRSMPLMVALSIIFPIQLLFLGKVVLGIIFLLTGGGFGIWYVIEWFLTPGRVRDYNTKVASNVLDRVKGSSSPAPKAEGPSPAPEPAESEDSTEEEAAAEAGEGQ